jgi:hypothetical protein
MPIKIGKRVFRRFEDAVAYIQTQKGLTKERAAAYVATIDRGEQEARKRTNKRRRK